MSVAAEKIAEVPALPAKDRAFLAHQLIASLDNVVDLDAETQWRDAIDAVRVKSRKARSVAVPWRRPSGTFAPSSMHVASHPEAEEELEAAALWYEERQPGLPRCVLRASARVLPSMI
jgi:hypothetical protein